MRHADPAGAADLRQDARHPARGGSLLNQLEADDAFQDPIAYDDIDPEQYDAFILPGGHAPETRPFLESEVLQQRAIPR